MRILPEAFEETVGVARDYLQASASEPLPLTRLSRDFAEMIVKISESCVIGLPCEKHGGAVHGQEAEELRAGVERILKNTGDVRDGEAAFVLVELRKSLIFLLDHIDARDSLAFLEITDPQDEEGAS